MTDRMPTKYKYKRTQFVAWLAPLETVSLSLRLSLSLSLFLLFSSFFLLFSFFFDISDSIFLA